MKNIFLRKSAPITCPNCLESVLIMARDVFENDFIEADDVEVQEKYRNKYKSPEDGDKICCLSCKTEFLSITRLNEIEGVFE